MKALSPKMEDAYHPANVEKEWYEWWESSKFFTPETKTEASSDKEPFVVVLPPPNVTGYLHLGHALTGAVQDTICRYQRMTGREVLYLPGTDHAGIATQVVVEKRLMASEGKSRYDLGREEFMKRLWAFKNEHSGVIQKQLRKLGSSLDWSRERFTMDEQCARGVTEAFVKLHEDGKIYRATRLVNWCCALQSAISDLEVDYDDVEKNAKLTIPNYDKKVDMGMLTKIAYKVVGSDSELIIATTRPETLLGDTAVAIHPEDERYKSLHGKTLKCPFRDAEIPIVLDSTLVDMNFGTGAVKITPAHDPNDFESGKRHNLEQITIMDLKGYITMDSPFKGLHRFDCRKKIIEELKKLDLLRGEEPYSNRVGRCSRTGDIVEPLLMPQWFVDCTEMAQKSVDAVRNKELKITPEAQEAVWFHWLENIKPWCVSRQLWWGHRIPAYQIVLAGTPTDDWVVARSPEEAKEKALKQIGEDKKDELELRQDPDVLDTWFSSALWPFSTMGWPEKTPDFEKFFPGSLLETGHDILFFWVARMVMASLHFTGKLPFKEVYLHAMVRDKDGRKMSKSLGNVIDPLDVMYGITLEALHKKVENGNLDAKEVPKAIKYQKTAFPKGIPECGSDALRFGLLSYTQSGKNVNMDIDRIVGYRQFCNKLWNVIRYILYFALGDDYKPEKLSFTPSDDIPFECKWILSRLERSVEECNRGFSEGTYDFAMTTNAAYRFFLYELCDVFLELTKPIMHGSDEKRKQTTRDVLLFVVERALRLLHPMMPFVTEELWHRLPTVASFKVESIMLAAYPQVEGFASDEIEADMKLVMDAVHAVRSMKASYQLTNKVKPEIWISCRSEKQFALFEAQKLIVTTLGVSGEAKVISESESAAEGCGFSVVNKDVGIHMMLKGHIDVAKEVEKLKKNVTALEKQLDGLAKKMSIPNYETKVPEDVRKLNDEKKVSLETQKEQLIEAVQRMEKMK